MACCGKDTKGKAKGEARSQAMKERCSKEESVLTFYRGLLVLVVVQGVSCTPGANCQSALTLADSLTRFRGHDRQRGVKKKTKGK